MQFPTSLLPGRLVRRYKRFLADVVLDGAPGHNGVADEGGSAGGVAVTAHCPNSGAMLGLDQPGSAVWLSVHDNPKRTYRHTLELVAADGTLVGVNTQHPNRIVAEAIADQRIAALAGYARLRREVPYGTASRVDLLLEDDARPPAFVEVKNVHLRRAERWNGRAAEFPDCPTARGARHLGELARVAAAGARAVLVYLVQRGDCDHLRIAADLDPAYAKAAAAARAAGVEMLGYACRIDRAGIDLGRPLPLVW